MPGYNFCEAVHGSLSFSGDSPVVERKQMFNVGLIFTGFHPNVSSFVTNMN